MRDYLFTRLLQLALILIAPVACAQTNPPLDQIETPAAPSPNHLALSYRVGFNIKANFRNLGVVPPSAPGPASSGTDHIYDDGYNRVDISGNAGGSTWYWGYNQDSQIVGDNILFHSSRGGTISEDAGGDASHGLELTYNRQLGTWGRWGWGLEAAINYAAVNIHNTSTRADGPLTVDSYALRGIIPPLAPYAGTYAGPGALISDSPNRLPVTVTSKLDADVYGFRLGPYLGIPITQRLGFSFSGGLALLMVNSDFAFQESVPSGIYKSAAGSHNDLLAGGYAAGTISFALSRSINLSAGVQYQSAGRYSHREADKQAEIDFGNSIFLTVGAGFSF